VIPSLAEHFTVIAPDLLGHGESAKPRGDYSLGAYASGIRDLLIALGHERATFVGHSLGGGVAMQLAYQFPERCERLVLIGSGGLGDEVSWLLRAASLPGSELVLPLLVNERVLWAGRSSACEPTGGSARAGSFQPHVVTLLPLPRPTPRYGHALPMKGDSAVLRAGGSALSASGRGAFGRLRGQRVALGRATMSPLKVTA
jgi:pimeloyl-ACP methyl ester carboxylesterase